MVGKNEVNFAEEIKINIPGFIWHDHLDQPK